MECRKGLTLIELMIVVVLISILVTLAVTRYRAAIGKSRRSESLMVLKQLYGLELCYYEEYGTYAASLAPNLFPIKTWMLPSETRRYDYTACPGKTGDIETSVWIVATEKNDADLDGNKFEQIRIDEEGVFYGDM
ncbi:MAG: hypothetical protein B6D65_01530 [candidate division Zixibacteria bacterium 4484_93]|nr:MAG: hypothetical protein B6D65_01530 [candidate division Zixibacteria bacterium 4484_93]